MTDSVRDGKNDFFEARLSADYSNRFHTKKKLNNEKSALNNENSVQK